MGVSLFDPKSPLVQFNKKLHESSLYNGFQMTISVLDVFTAGFTKGMKNPICFVAGTMVLTAMGLKAIETIQAGDQVIATNPDTFQTEEKKVVETYINKTTCIVKIFIQNEVIYTTMNHPFYVKGQGFVAACKLSMGDEIMNASGGSYPVECVELEERQEVVYNFQVEDYHTYYVGENSVLVHNDCPEGETPTEDGSGSKSQEVFDTADNYNLSEDTFNNHILDRHGPNSAYSNKSHFNADFDIKSGIDSTLKGDNFIVKPNTGGRSGYIFEQTFKDAIGVNSKGQPIYTLKVVIDDSGNVITAFPKK